MFFAAGVLLPPFHLPHRLPLAGPAFVGDKPGSGVPPGDRLELPCKNALGQAFGCAFALQKLAAAEVGKKIRRSAGVR